MNITVDMKLNLDSKGVRDLIFGASRSGLRDTIVEIADDAIKGSPVKYGTNRRSIKYEVGMGEVTRGDLEAATYSTSGYGGFLETGTYKMAARPYFRPALDKHGPKLGANIKRYMP